MRHNVIKIFAFLLIASFYFPKTASANIIFPAAVTVAGLSLASILFFGIPIILVEAFVLHKLLPRPFKESVITVFVANFASSVIGAFLLGGGLLYVNTFVDKIYREPIYSYFFSIIVMFFGTVIIELVVTKLKYRNEPLAKLLLAVSLGNIATYGLMLYELLAQPPQYF